VKLAFSSQIKEIDAFAINTLGIPAEVLMGRSGRAVADAVRSVSPDGGSVLILAGKGNNGGDGYAAATELIPDYTVAVLDVFSAGQKSEEGKYYLEKYLSLGGRVINTCDPSLNDVISRSDVIVDAIFGTGFLGTPPDSLRHLSNLVNESPSKKIAVDVPLGVNADDGSISDISIPADLTIALSYLKPGLLSYPAKEICGKVILDSIGMPKKVIEKSIHFSNYLFDLEEAIKALPTREENSSKGSFGKALLVTGSKTYPGAGILTLEAALRGGAGYVTQVADSPEIREYIKSFPEALFNRDLISGDRYDIDGITALSSKSNATLIGSGCEATSHLADLTESLIKTEGSPLIIDASAINALAEYKGREVLREAKRKIILTPHPLEFSRLTGQSVDEIQKNRISVARSFAKKYGITLILKGAATVTTDGDRLYINSTGSSALAKAGSGDVLAGLLASILAYHPDPLTASALAVYLHGAAADRLSMELSRFGVTPSDLPKEIAKIIREIEIQKGENI
jgi:NAD(P)H-hydrate epimerase